MEVRQNEKRPRSYTLELYFMVIIQIFQNKLCNMHLSAQ